MSLFSSPDSSSTSAPSTMTIAPPRAVQRVDDSRDHGAETKLEYRPGKPSAAFVGVSWVALLVGSTAYLIGLYNAHMALSAKGYYLTLLLYGLFAAVSVQKAVRDRLEGVPVSSLFLGLAWASVASVLTLLSVGLWNADLLRSEKGFYAMSFCLAMFAAVAVQKNVRDLSASSEPAA